MFEEQWDKLVNDPSVSCTCAREGLRRLAILVKGHFPEASCYAVMLFQAPNHPVRGQVDYQLVVQLEGGLCFLNPFPLRGVLREDVPTLARVTFWLGNPVDVEAATGKMAMRWGRRLSSFEELTDDKLSGEQPILGLLPRPHLTEEPVEAAVPDVDYVGRAPLGTPGFRPPVRQISGPL